jgi:plasmid stabilization system protein ParE
MRVVVSERAEKNLQALANYLEQKWSLRVRNKFIDLLKKKVEQLARTPEMYEVFGKHNIR